MFAILHTVIFFLITTTPCDRDTIIIPVSHMGRLRLKAVRSLASVTQLIASEARPGCFLLLKAVISLSFCSAVTMSCARGQTGTFTTLWKLHSWCSHWGLPSWEALPHPSLRALTVLAYTFCHPHHSLTHVVEGVRWVGEHWTFTVPCKALANQGWIELISQGGTQHYAMTWLATLKKQNKQPVPSPPKKN